MIQVSIHDASIMQIPTEALKELIERHGYIFGGELPTTYGAEHYYDNAQVNSDFLAFPQPRLYIQNVKPGLEHLVDPLWHRNAVVDVIKSVAALTNQSELEVYFELAPTDPLAIAWAFCKDAIEDAEASLDAEVTLRTVLDDLDSIDDERNAYAEYLTRQGAYRAGYALKEADDLRERQFDIGDLVETHRAIRGHEVTDGGSSDFIIGSAQYGVIESVTTDGRLDVRFRSQQLVLDPIVLNLAAKVSDKVEFVTEFKDEDSTSPWVAEVGTLAWRVDQEGGETTVVFDPAFDPVSFWTVPSAAVRPITAEESR